MSTPPYELPPTIIEPIPPSRRWPDHEHEWRFATVIPHQRKHVITEQPLQMLSVFMTCFCSAQLHTWLCPPPEPRADVQRDAGMASPSLMGSKPA